MKYERLFRAALLAAAFLCTTGMASAKDVVTPKMYMFGFAASFSDSIVHFTDIQEVDSVWIDGKTKFILGRDNYSYQLREYLSSQSLPHRTCIILYNPDRTKLEKEYQKMQKLYGPDKKGQLHYDLRTVTQPAFRFHAIDMTAEEEVVPEPKKPAKPAKKEKKKK